MSKDARQNVNAAYQEFVLADLPSGTAVDLFSKLKADVVPLTLQVIVLDDSDAATSDVLDIGTAAAPSAYINDANLKAAAGTSTLAAVLPGKVGTGGLQLKATRTAVGATTGLRVAVSMTYVVKGRAHFPG